MTGLRGAVASASVARVSRLALGSLLSRSTLLALAALALLLGFTALTAPASAAAPPSATEPAPESTSAQVSPGPAPVADLLANDLDRALAQIPTAELGTLAGRAEKLTAGPTLEVLTWNGERARGDTAAPVAVPTGRWLAVLRDAGNPVGTVEVAWEEGGRARVVGAGDDPDLAADLEALPAGQSVVEDPIGGGHFMIVAGRVTPVDAAAREVLAGSVPADDFMALLAQQQAQRTPTPAPAVEEAGRWWIPLAVGGGVLAVLLTVGFAVWLQRPDAPGEDAEPATPRGMLLLRRPVTRAGVAEDDPR